MTRILREKLVIAVLLSSCSVFAQQSTMSLGESFLTSEDSVQMGLSSIVVEDVEIAPDTETIILDGIEVIRDIPEIEVLDEKRIGVDGAPYYVGREEVRDHSMSALDIEMIPDSVFIQRLSLLNDQSPFNLDYNRHVRGRISSYLNKNVQVTARVLGLAEMYFPMFEEALDRHGLPLELKYLAVIESALQPTARSRAGATGLWQFMYATGKEQGLHISSYIDERKSPRESTEAACIFLKKLYNMYGDWNLALAAYNSGPGNVNKAMRRAGGKNDYWEIWSYLPRETRGYVPAFIAVNYVMSYHEEHGIIPIKPEMRYDQIDTIMVRGPLDFYQITRFTTVDIEELRWLNPQYHRDLIPDMGKAVELVLPIEHVGDFVMNEGNMRQYKAPIVKEAVTSRTSVQNSSGYYSTDGLTKHIYTVRSGDVLGTIAERHGVGVSKVRYWNNLSGSRIYTGQKLKIYTASAKAPSQTVAKQKPLPSITDDANARYHTIRKGDTLWDIAKLYNDVTITQIKSWNSHLDFKRLKPGQRVRVSG